MTDELFAKYVTVDRLEEVMVRVGYKSPDDMWCLIDEMIEDIWTHSKDDIPWSKPVERLLAKETVKLFYTVHPTHTPG